MVYPALENYLARLSSEAQSDTRVWIDGNSRVQGRYFNCTLTSAFQPVRELSAGLAIGFEAFVRSYSWQDDGLSLWKLLEQAANDDESVELDRLCRMLHAINYYRQPEAGTSDLYLSVHDRLLAAVSSNHGMAFRRILEGLGLPIQQVVLQLPATTVNQGWLLHHVSENYRLNGFRFAVNVRDAAEALRLLDRIRPDVIKVDARDMGAVPAFRQLLLETHAAGVRVIFKRLDNLSVMQALNRLADETGLEIYAQGRLWEAPNQALAAFDPIKILQQDALPLRLARIAV